MEEDSSPSESQDRQETTPVSVLEDPNVCSVHVGNKEIVIVGTAHVSRASADLVEKAIREIKPDSVAVELCSGRYEALRNPEQWKNTNIVSVIRQGKAHLLIAQLLLSSFQRRIAKQLGVRPGEEMLRAMNLADEQDVPTVLADRDVTTTLKRTWAALSWKSLFKVFFSGLFSVFEEEKISEEEIERLKTADALEEALSELSGALPEVRTTLIDERDRYLAHKISEAPGERVVAVIGAGHMAGVRGYLGKPQDLEMLEKIPPPSPWGKRIEIGLLLALIAAFGYGFVHAGAKVGASLVLTWAAATAIAGAIGAAIALAHPLTILAATLSAPIAAIHPLIATGWVAGMVEAWIRQPRVADFESLLDDVNTMGGWWRNRVSRILLVVVTTNLAVTAGNLLGTGMLLKAASAIH